MAITKLLHIKAKSNLFAAIAYVMNPEKTENGVFVGGNSGNEPQEVYHIMKQTKTDWEKPEGRQGYHFILSWKPGETDAQTAYRMIKEFCEEYLGDGYDYVFAVHNDRDHMHGHVVFNSVNRVTGYKYRYEKGDWEKKIQPVTDRICERYYLSHLEYEQEEPVGISYAEWNQGEKVTWKKIIRADIDYAISQASNYGEFLQNLRKMGYEIKIGISHMKGEAGEMLSLKSPGQNRAWRTKKHTLGDMYTLEAIKERIRKTSQNLHPNYIRPPRMQKCRGHGLLIRKSSLSKFQFLFVRKIYQVSVLYMRKNPYAVKAGQVRKNWIRIEQLRRDCAYLIRENIRSRDELNERETQLRELFSSYRRNCELSKKLPLGAAEGDLTEQWERIRQEKRIIRHIRKMDQEWQKDRENLKKIRQLGLEVEESVGIQK